MFARGDIVLVAEGPYSSKPRPVLVLQHSEAYTGDSVVIVPFTTTASDSIKFRVKVNPTKQNGLDRICFLEVDKVSAIRSSAINKRVGKLEANSLGKAASLLIELLGIS
jgi:mRNA-degrading endonuclease toxin of MazEF toxin-antitoxin module